MLMFFIKQYFFFALSIDAGKDALSSRVRFLQEAAVTAASALFLHLFSTNAPASWLVKLLRVCFKV